MTQTAQNPAESRHPFARAGYAGPYKFVAPHLALHHVPGETARAGGSCDVCGTGYKYGATFEDANGVRFRTGCDCAWKALRDYDSDLAEQAKQARKTLKRQLRDEARAKTRAERAAERERERLEEERQLNSQIDEIDMDELEKYAHPMDWAARKGLSWADAVRYWMDERSNARKALDCAYEAREAIAKGYAVPRRKPVTVDPAVSKHVGAIKKRQVFEATCMCVISFETAYGVQHVVKLVDDEGNLLVWKTSNPGGLDGEDEHGRRKFLDQGDRVTFKATVKDHGTDSYNDDAKCTYITRCKRV